MGTEPPDGAAGPGLAIGELEPAACPTDGPLAGAAALPAGAWAPAEPDVPPDVGGGAEPGAAAEDPPDAPEPVGFEPGTLEPVAPEPDWPERGALSAAWSGAARASVPGWNAAGLIASVTPPWVPFALFVDAAPGGTATSSMPRCWASEPRSRGDSWVIAASAPAAVRAAAMIFPRCRFPPCAGVLRCAPPVRAATRVAACVAGARVAGAGVVGVVSGLAGVLSEQCRPTTSPFA